MTQLEYLANTYLFHLNTVVEAVYEKEDGFEVITASTVFHPQGGGQPSDIGVMRSADGAVFSVSHVTKSHEGIVSHFGSFEGMCFHLGDTVSMSVDEEKRVLHARLHSAGHLVDVAMFNCGYVFPSGKGYHFPKGAYVEYQGDIPAEKRNEALHVLQRNVDRLVRDDLRMIVQDRNGKRWVQFEGTDGCGCGGTHVKSSGMLGTIKLTKLQRKRGCIRVKYEIA